MLIANPPWTWIIEMTVHRKAVFATQIEAIYRRRNQHKPWASSCSQVTVLFYIYSVQKLASFLVIILVSLSLVDENLSMSSLDSSPGRAHKGYWKRVGTCDHFWKQSVYLSDPLPSRGKIQMLKAAISSHSILIYHAFVTCNFCPICGQKAVKADS